ncbi:hypothetical protein [Corynebacterium qintianiae]|uniref:hypothetical protein n=1 Tax=Corynebacterium qintianiae TaxID=2709392 RepID=UPI0013EE3C94|nr:hypothetical protein [Corynebacterium qintianiae]
MTEQSLDDAPSDAPVDANTRLLRALPAPVFTVAYGAIVIALIAGAVVLADNASSQESAAPVVGKPARPFFPVQTDVDNVEASVRPYLITDTASARTASGVTLTGTMTDQAETDVSEFAGHVSRLLEQNCVDNMTVRSQDNVRINLWGYCYHSPGAAEIETYVEAALENSADSVSFSFYPGLPVEHQVALTWFEDTADDADAAMDSWEDIEPVGRIQQVSLSSYDPAAVRQKDVFAEPDQ